MSNEFCCTWKWKTERKHRNPTNKIYKQAEIDEENFVIEEELNEGEIKHEHSKLYLKLPCDNSDFESDSRRGLCVHIGMKNKKADENVK